MTAIEHRVVASACRMNSNYASRPVRVGPYPAWFAGTKEMDMSASLRFELILGG
jgi:hypothetical protein